MLNFVIETIGVSGLSLYVVIFNCITGQVWNTTLNAGAGGWENYNSGHWAQYAIALTEKAGSGYYSGTYPAAIAAANVLTTEVIYANGTPTLGDAPQGIGQSQGVSVRAIAGDAAAGANLQRSASGMVLGAVAAGSLTSSAFTTDLASTTNAAYQGRVILFTSGVLIGQVGNIIAYNGTTRAVTVGGPFTAAPSAADKFVIV